MRKTYDHPGFSLDDIVRHHTEFVDYMEQHGAPIGGTSGAGGGSPKFLLRQDALGKFHADGMLDDAKTSQCFLVKFPYSDSSNSVQLSHTEKLYYDLMRELPVNAGAAIAVHGDILFVSRFDRQHAGGGRILYLGLESFYGAHDVNIHGARLSHEDNLLLLQKYSSDATADAIEYLQRDILNKILGNTDNHGRNSSLLKKEGSIRLAPIYDVTAMKFFVGDFIVELTRWQDQQATLRKQVAWIAANLEIPRPLLIARIRHLSNSLGDVAAKLRRLGVPPAFIEGTADERARMMQEMQELTA
jgi:serine/threonine-protein kinase HipA